MRKLRLVLGDLGYTNKYTREYMYVPLNIGYVAQYCLQHFGDDIEVKLFKDPDKLLEYCRANKPDVLGLSFYYWNTDINNAVTKRLRAQYGKDLTIIQGGASVGTDARELNGLFDRFPQVDAYVINEGELGFANALRDRLAGELFKKPIDGAVFREGEHLVQGLPVGLTLDLGTLKSPFLSGLLDEFMQPDGLYMPMIQASRLCPYTCAFCTSGKNRGKLRMFPDEQVKAEIDLIAEKYKNRPHMMLLLSDENFGILPRDVGLAHYIREKSERAHYPQSVFFYNDKRFTQTSKNVIEALGQVNTHGLILSLQSENPETLKEVKRRNLTPEDIEAALKWASDLNMPTSTELIFGMPYETRQSFVDLMRSCVERGFDSILGFNLFLMNGIELNTPQSRAKFQVKTMFRPVNTYYGDLDGEFCAESEEIVVSSNSFTMEDFLFIRSLNFVFYSVFALGFYRSFFQYVRHTGVDFTKVMLDFICPPKGADIDPRHAKFAEDFRRAITEELFETREAVKEHLEKVFTKAGRKVDEPIRQNVLYGSRLIYLEQDWIAESLLQTLARHIDPKARPEVFERAKFVLELCKRERIDINGKHEPEPLRTEYDVAAWKADKYKRPLEEYAMAPQMIEFKTRKDILNRLESFRKAFAEFDAQGMAYAALDFMGRRDLLYKLDYPSSRESFMLARAVPQAVPTGPSTTGAGTATHPANR
jgi:radical SAM superfamily enzyme YgiQ (UPF0313 family)